MNAAMSSKGTQAEDAPAMMARRLLWAQVCEVCAPKAGNVHLGASFDDTAVKDFLRSAAVVSPILAQVKRMGVGACVLEAVRATKQVVGRNTNLGIILLLAPLVAARPGQEMRALVEGLTLEDAAAVYEGIMLANPGGLGHAEKGDVTTGDVLPLKRAMALAAERDVIACEYIQGFSGVSSLAKVLSLAVAKWGLEQGIVHAHLWQMATSPDTLILRKLGQAAAVESSRLARVVVDGGWTAQGPVSRDAFDVLDEWLRAEGNRRNPGASADMIAAALFVIFERDLPVLPGAWQRELEGLV